MTNAISSSTLPSAANDLATRSDTELGGDCNSAAGHQLQHSVKHTRLRAARCLFLPRIPYDPSYSSTVFCVPDCIKSIQRKSSSRRAACDVRPQKTSHETRFVLARHLVKIWGNKNFFLVGAPGLEPGTRRLRDSEGSRTIKDLLVAPLGLSGRNGHSSHRSMSFLAYQFSEWFEHCCCETRRHLRVSDPLQLE
jgi:hypothetical protein